MNVEFEIPIGSLRYKFSGEVHSMKEFFQLVAPYQCLPQCGPNGETDLEICHRKPKGFEYFSIVSRKAAMEFKLGVLNDQSGNLFPKGWEQLVRGADEDHSDDEYEPRQEPQRATPPSQQASPREVGHQMAATPADLRTKVQRILVDVGVDNLGREKSYVMKALGLRIGRSVNELSQAELTQLYGTLVTDAVPASSQPSRSTPAQRGREAQY